MADSTNVQMANLHRSLEAAEAHIRLLKDETNIARDKEILLEQLARAYCQLQNIYVTHSQPDRYEFSVSEIGAWVSSLEHAAGNDIYKVVLDRSYQLDDKKYGTKNRDPSVADKGWINDLPPGHVLSKTGRRSYFGHSQEEDTHAAGTH